MKNHFRSFLTIILSSCLLICPNMNIHGQVQGLKLSDYVNPDYHYQRLDVGLNFNSGFNNNQSKTEWGSLNTTRTSKYSSLSSTISPEYYRTSNSSRYQGSQLISITLSDQFSGNNNGSSTSNYNSKVNESQNFLNLSLGSTNRFYFKPKYFFELNPRLNIRASMDVSGSKDTDSTGLVQVQSKFHKNYFGDAEGVGIYAGIGRIEMVQDVQTAAFILNDLARVNRVKSSISQDDVFELARLITQLRTTRFFDTRIQKIREITAIDSLLQKNGWVGKADAAYFTTINDNWNYAFNPVRSSGYRLYAGTEPFLQNNISIEKTTNIIPLSDDLKTRKKYLSLETPVIIGFIWEKPSSLKWQHTLVTSLEWYYSMGESRQKQLLPVEGDEFMERQVTLTYWSYDFGYSLGFYPTTRTNMTVGINSSIYSNKSKQESANQPTWDGIKHFSSNIQLFFNTNYYISERLRFLVNARIGWPVNKNESGTPPDPNYINMKTRDSDFGASLSASFTYSLF